MFSGSRKGLMFPLYSFKLRTCLDLLLWAWKIFFIYHGSSDLRCNTTKLFSFQSQMHIDYRTFRFRRDLSDLDKCLPHDSIDHKPSLVNLGSEPRLITLHLLITIPTFHKITISYNYLITLSVEGWKLRQNKVWKEARQRTHESVCDRPVKDGCVFYRRDVCDVRMKRTLSDKPSVPRILLMKRCHPSGLNKIVWWSHCFHKGQPYLEHSSGLANYNGHWS